MFGCKRMLDELLQNPIVGVFGKPRAGKTCITAGIVAENNKRKEKGKGKYFDRIYCNDHTIKGTIPYTIDQFGTWDIKDNSLICIEEAGIALNNRNWKKLTDSQKEDIAMIGHYKSSILWSSQRSDVDCNLLGRTHVIYLVEKLSRAFSFIRTIDFSIDVDNEKGEIIDRYHKPQGLYEIIQAIRERKFKILYRPQYYKFFDSFRRNTHKRGRDPEDIQKEKAQI